MIHVALERNRMVGRLPWGTDIPLRPFFGVMANAPPRAWGTVSSIQPRQFGGNMDNKELVAGTTLYLPVFVDERAVLGRRRPRAPRATARSASTPSRPA